MKPKVSIIIPVYNAKKWIKRCIDSISNQEYKNIEIIAINDGSTDDTLSFLNDLKKTCSNLIVLDKKNEGVAKTRNYGIKKASGKYIMFIDNDDYIDKDYVSSFVNKIDKDNLDLVIGGYERVGLNNKVLDCVLPSFDKLGMYKIVAPWAKIYNLEFLRKNHITFLDSNIGEDIYFNLQVINKTSKIGFINNVGYKWFYNETSISNTVHKKISKDLQFNYLLDECYKVLTKQKKEKNLENEYFFIKTVCWYIYYISKGNDTDLVYEELVKYKKWLHKHYNHYKNNCYLSLFNNKSEPFKVTMGIRLLIKSDSKIINKIAIKISR